jgi:hypothetical protein
MRNGRINKRVELRARFRRNMNIYLLLQRTNMGLLQRELALSNCGKVGEMLQGPPLKMPRATHA